MQRTVHYKQGYKIVIRNKFYEISAGKKVLCYGQLKHRPTPQEVWNKTIGLEMEKEEFINGIKRVKEIKETDI